MTEDRLRPVDGGKERHWTERLAEWKVQLLALAGAPFLGIGFVFEFSLRARDFPELASAIWGFLVLFIGIFFFMLCLLLAGVMAAILDVHEATHSTNGWRRLPAIWVPRALAALAVTVLLVCGYLVFLRSADGFGSFEKPYVEWLHDQTK